MPLSDWRRQRADLPFAVPFVALSRRTNDGHASRGARHTLLWEPSRRSARFKPLQKCSPSPFRTDTCPKKKITSARSAPSIYSSVVRSVEKSGVVLYLDAYSRTAILVLALLRIFVLYICAYTMHWLLIAQNSPYKLCGKTSLQQQWKPESSYLH